MKKYLLFTVISLVLLGPLMVLGVGPAFPIQGGTGTSTIPNSGDLLVGQSNGTYAPVAISLLGFRGPYLTVCNSSTCDYITDGTADDVQINAAITAANSGSSSAAVYIKKGTYDIASSIFLRSNVLVLGDGVGVTILKRNSSAGPNITIVATSTGSETSVSNIALRDFTVNGNETSPIAGHYNIVFSKSLAGVPVNNILVSNITSSSSSASGLIVYGVSNAWLDNIKVKSASQTTTADGIDVELSDHIYLDSIDLATGDDGVVVSSSQYVHANKINNKNTVAGGAFRVGGNTDIGQAHHITASNISCDNCDSTVSISAVQTMSESIGDIAISNVVASSGNYAIKIQASSGLQDGITFPFNDITITGVTSINQQSGISIGKNGKYAANNVKISNAIIRNSVGHGIELYTGNNVEFNNVSILNSGARGVNIFATQATGTNYVSNIQFNNLQVSTSTGYGINISAVGTEPEIYQPDIHFNGGFVKGSGLTGVNWFKVRATFDNFEVANGASDGVDVTTIASSSSSYTNSATQDSYIKNSLFDNNGGLGILPRQNNVLHVIDSKVTGNASGNGYGSFPPKYSTLNFDTYTEFRNNIYLPNGNLGIGTSTPQDKFVLQNGIFTLTDNAAVDRIKLYSNSLSASPLSDSVSAAIFTTTNGGTIYPFLTAGNLVIQPRTSSGAGRDIVFMTGATTATTSMVIASSSNIGIGIGVSDPTHSLTLNSRATGIALYNTADQITDYERALLNWSSNNFTIQTAKGGAGTGRNLILRTPSRVFTIDETGGTGGFLSTIYGTSAIIPELFTQITRSNTSGIAVGVSISPVLNQSSSAGYTALSVQPTESTLGNSAKTLFQLGTSTVPNLFLVNNLGAVGVNNSFGSSGQIFQSNGASSTPSWVATSSLGLAPTLSGGLIGFVTRWLTANTVGTGKFLDDGTVTGVNATSSSYTFNLQGNSGTNPFNIASSTGNSLFTVLNNGNIGIGTSTPTTALVITNGIFTLSDNVAVDRLKLYASSQNAAPLSNTVSGAIYTTGTGGTSYPFLTAGNLVFQPRTTTGGARDIVFLAGNTNATTTMVVASTGNVGIGTTTPGSLLSVSSSATTTVTWDSTSATKGACIKMKDADGVGYTYLVANNGVLTASTASCE